MMNVRDREDTCNSAFIQSLEVLASIKNNSVTLLTVLYNRSLVIEERFFPAARNCRIPRTVEWSFIRKVYKKAREQTHNPTASPSTAIRLSSGRHGLEEMHINPLLKPVHDENELGEKETAV